MHHGIFIFSQSYLIVDSIPRLNMQRLSLFFFYPLLKPKALKCWWFRTVNKRLASLLIPAPETLVCYGKTSQRWAITKTQAVSPALDPKAEPKAETASISDWFMRRPAPVWVSVTPGERAARRHLALSDIRARAQRSVLWSNPPSHNRNAFPRALSVSEKVQSEYLPESSRPVAWE